MLIVMLINTNIVTQEPSLQTIFEQLETQKVSTQIIAGLKAFIESEEYDTDAVIMDIMDR